MVLLIYCFHKVLLTVCDIIYRVRRATACSQESGSSAFLSVSVTHALSIIMILLQLPLTTLGLHLFDSHSPFEPGECQLPSIFFIRLHFFHASRPACRWPISNGSTTWWVTMASTQGRGFWYPSVIQISFWVAPATSRWIIMRREKLRYFTLRVVRVGKLNPRQISPLQRGEAGGFSSPWGGACMLMMGLPHTIYLFPKVIPGLPWWSTLRTWGGSSNV